MYVYIAPLFYCCCCFLDCCCFFLELILQAPHEEGAKRGEKFIFQKGLVRYLLGLLCALSIMTAGCQTGVSFIDDTTESIFGSSYDTWQDFQVDRPDPDAIEFNSETLTDSCAAITDLYSYTLEQFDRFTARLESCPIALELEAIYAEEGPEAYFAALDDLKKKERKAYHRYIDEELDHCNEFADIQYQAQDLFHGMKGITKGIRQEFKGSIDKNDPIATAAALAEAAESISIIASQVSYTMKCAEWLISYTTLLQDAKEHMRR